MGHDVGVGGCIPRDYFVSTQLQLWLFCCWGCGCCWAVIICVCLLKLNTLEVKGNLSQAVVALNDKQFLDGRSIVQILPVYVARELSPGEDEPPVLPDK